MQIKDGVIMQGLQKEMRPALIEADKIWAELNQELVITSALDGTHSAGSLHYYGLALDFRIHYFTDEEKTLAFRRLKRKLSPVYDVILHNTHIHVEYDPK